MLLLMNEWRRVTFSTFSNEPSKQKDYHLNWNARSTFYIIKLNFFIFIHIIIFIYSTCLLYGAYQDIIIWCTEWCGSVVIRSQVQIPTEVKILGKFFLICQSFDEYGYLVYVFSRRCHVFCAISLGMSKTPQL